MAIGLDDIVAAETALSDVDGHSGRLIIAGRSLDELIGVAGAEDVAALLWNAYFTPLHGLARHLAEARSEVFERALARLPDYGRLSIYDATRALVARLSDDLGFSTAVLLVAAPAVLVPALLRQRTGKLPIAPDSSLGHAADILRMLGGSGADEASQALDTYLVTVSDHGLNASTFAARVVASTGAGLTSSVLAAYGALKGPLHGGAPGPVLDTLDKVGHPGQAESVLREMLDRGERLMGFGHRIYRVRDPRADALKAALARLPPSPRIELALAVEASALKLLRERKPERPLETNVEFYTALLLDALGFPRDAFTAVFAMGRTPGWIAHACEQAQSGRLIRPRSVYVGPRPQQAA